jgi:hypothetical protein
MRDAVIHGAWVDSSRKEDGAGRCATLSNRPTHTGYSGRKPPHRAVPSRRSANPEASIERRPRIATLGNPKPAVVVSRVQDQGEAIVDLCDEFVGFGRDQGEGLEPGSVRPLPRVPDGGECEGEKT